MEYLTLDDALYIHAEQTRLFGRAPGVRHLGLIESALLRPQTGYYAISSSRRQHFGKASP